MPLELFSQDANLITQAVIQPYLTVRTQFKDSNTQKPIVLVSAVFEVLDVDTGQSIPSVRQHHLPYVNYPTVGWVQADIDTSSLEPDKEYIFRFTVKDENGNTLQSSSRVRMFQQTRLQWLVDQLRTVLLDAPTFGQWIPQHVHQRFLIRKPWEVEWQNEELVTYLNMSLSDINNAIPPTLHFTLEQCPAVSYLILGGSVYALMARSLVEVYNFYDTNAPVKVSVQKSDKFRGFLDWVDKNYRQQIERWKKAYALYRAHPKAVVLTRLPFTVIRPLSMMYGYGNLYQW